MPIVSTLKKGFVPPPWLVSQMTPPEPPPQEGRRGDWPRRWQCEICGEWKSPLDCTLTIAGEVICEECDQLSQDEQMERFLTFMEGPYALLNPLGIEVGT